MKATRDGHTQPVASPDEVITRIDPADLGLALAYLAETYPEHELLLAARLALAIADGRHAARRARREAALDVYSALTPRQWREYARNRVPFDELQRRRGLVRVADGTWRAAS